MDSNITDSDQTPEDESGKSSKKKVYHAPQIRRFGGLTDLVQLIPGRGGDGCINFADCTLS